IDAFIQNNRVATEEVSLDLVDRVDLARAGVIARAASDAGFVDVEMSRLAHRIAGPYANRRAGMAQIVERVGQVGTAAAARDALDHLAPGRQRGFRRE